MQRAWVDVALAQRHYATAVARLETIADRRHLSPELHWRAAQAYFQLGQDVGAAEVRAVPGGRTGQFNGRWLLIEPREPRGRFLCCPRASALYQLRRALDGGLDRPAAHVLHARIWQRLRRPEIGWALLRDREAALLATPTPDLLKAYSDLALAADALPDYLRYQRLQARLQPAKADGILGAACVALAERYGQRGEETLHVHWLRRAVRHRPQDVAVLVRLADAEWSTGNRRRAALTYRKVLREDSDHPQGARMRRRIAAAAADQPN